MKRASDNEDDDKKIKKQRTKEPGNTLSQPWFSLNALFSFFRSRTAQTSIHNPPIFTLPLELLSRILAEASLPERLYPENANLVCAQFLNAINLLRIRQFNKSKASNKPCLDDNSLAGLLASQEAEIAYLLKNKEQILDITSVKGFVWGKKHASLVKKHFDDLKEAGQLSYDLSKFFVRESLLDKINCAIIEKRINERKNFRLQKKLRCADSYLTRFPDSILNCLEYQEFFNTVEVVDFHHNELKGLPSKIGQLRSLWELTLSQNKIEVLPPQIGQLTTLRNLWLSTNELKALPPEIGKLQGLHTLCLFNNKLEKLPPEITHLSKLEALQLSHNRLHVLPDGLNESVFKAYPGITKEHILAQQGSLDDLFQRVKIVYSP